MTRRVDPRAIARQRLGKVKMLAPLEPVPRTGTASRSSTRAPRWQDRISRKAQAEQLKREPYCRICAAKGMQVPATEVDHVTPRHAGGSMTATSNLRSLCHDCHVDVTLADRARRTGRPVRRKRKVKIDPKTGYPLPGESHWWAESLPHKGKN